MRYGDPMRDILAAAVERRLQEDEAPRPLTEAILEELKCIQRRYAKGCPFKPGDLVTPRPTDRMKGVGEPHIVLEIFDPPLRRDAGRPGSDLEFGRIDMRVACWLGGSYGAYAAESWQYEPWQPTKGD